MGVIGVIVSHILNKELNYQTLWDRKYKICVENGEEVELDIIEIKNCKYMTRRVYMPILKIYY